jgi:hypothetical protein
MLRLATTILFAMAAFAAPVGMFQGRLLQKPQGGWLYVVGRNQAVRRVALGQARVTYASSIPVNRRSTDPESLLVAGAEVRVTAEQGSDGEWRAREVVLIHLGPTERNTVAQVYPGIR